MIWSLELGASDSQFPAGLLNYVLLRRPDEVLQQTPNSFAALDYERVAIRIEDGPREVVNACRRDTANPLAKP